MERNEEKIGKKEQIKKKALKGNKLFLFAHLKSFYLFWLINMKFK